MSTNKTAKALALAVLLIITFFQPRHAVAQTDGKPAPVIDNAAGLEVQLDLIVATKGESTSDEKIPSALDAVVKRLRSTFQFRDYRLAATLLNRVKNGGRLNLRWVGAPLLPMAAATTATPRFNEFNVNTIKFAPGDAGRHSIELLGFRFGAHIPIQMSAVASTGSVGVVQYENTGISTDITVREGEPTIVGTLNVGPSGDALIIVVSARRPASN